MKLNAEQIKRALECCASQSYPSCCECPYHDLYGNKCITTRNNDIRDLINSQEQRIKELTQAHEMLSESYDHLEKTKDELLAERSRLTEENEAWQKALITEKENADKAYYELACEVEDLRAENERLNKEVKYWEVETKEARADIDQAVTEARAETVRKMQELLYKDFNTTTKPDMYIKSIIDKRVKEMLEDKQCT